jgi:hypothetical protein
MNHDEFSDQIRRKLESVEPQFQEKDWTRMQQALGHSTPVIAFGTRAGLMAAASVAAIMAFGGVAYQQYRTNQHLREQVQTLNQTVQTLRKATKSGPSTSAIIPALPPDTVYLTREVIRYVPVPYERKRLDGSDLGVDPAPTERLANAQNAPNTPNSPTNSLNPNTTGTTTTFNNRTGSNTNRPSTGQTTTPLRQGTRTTSDVTREQGNTSMAGNQGGTTSAETNTSESAQVAPSAQLTSMTTQPFRYDSAYYREGVARTTRRVRRMLSALSPSGTALAKVEVNRNEPNWALRFGPGANLGWQQWSAGLFAELRLTSHWRLGIGLNSVNLKGESFLSETDYGRRRPEPFRQKYAPGIDPRYAIININPTGSSWQVPLMVSYRMGLGSGWSLVPSVGVNLSLSNREEIGFSYLRGPIAGESIIPATILLKHPQKTLHTGSAALLLEKNWGDWALQLGPYASTPLSSEPSRLNLKTAGASARLFYQVDWKKKR